MVACVYNSEDSCRDICGGWKKVSRISIPPVWIHLTFVVHLSYCYGDIVCNAIQKVQAKQTELGCGTLIIFLRI